MRTIEKWTGKCQNALCIQPGKFTLEISRNSVTHVTCESCRKEYRIVMIEGQVIQMTESSVDLKAITDSDKQK